MRYPALAASVAGLLLSALPLATPSVHGDAPTAAPIPSGANLQAQARRCRQILKTSIIDFYLPACVDRKDGGYFEALKGDRFAPTGEKFLTLQSRQLWFFSTLAAAGIEKEAALAAAKIGFDFVASYINAGIGAIHNDIGGGGCGKTEEAAELSDVGNVKIGILHNGDVHAGTVGRARW